MHWVFYVIAAAVTALAIYVQMKRIEKGTQENAGSQNESSPLGEAIKKKKPPKKS